MPDMFDPSQRLDSDAGPIGPALLGEAAAPKEAPVRVVPAPPPGFLESRMPSFAAVCLWLLVLSVFAGIGYVGYQRYRGGYLQQDATSSADRDIRHGYENIRRGLEIPDAHHLVGLVPNRHKREINEVDIEHKTNDLKSRRIKCEIKVEKIEPKLDTTSKPWPVVEEATATVSVRWSNEGSRPESHRGSQKWVFQNGRWVPTEWKVFGSAPLAFEKWAGDDQILD